MSKRYRNDVSNSFKICNILNYILSILYIFSIVLSILLFLNFNDIICDILIIIYLFHFIGSILNNIFLIDIAENENRKANISNAFNVNLSDKKTKGYYNNDENYSMKKLFVNSLESIYFTRNILNKNIIRQTIFTFIELVVWISIILLIKDRNFLLLITQTIFSTEIIESYIKYVYYDIKVNRLFNDMFILLVNEKYSQEKEPLLLNYCLEYECIKSSSKIMLNSKTFHKYNDDLASEWSKIKRIINKRR